MSNKSLYPLRFEPIYQYRLWGGRRLENFLSKPLPKAEPVGEAWLLSDRADHPSIVTNGVLKGYTLPQLINDFPFEMMGKISGRFIRFPLLLKFLDCKEVLSVQVHPSDEQKEYIPAGDKGKTEAWVVMEESKGSLIYAGLKPSTNAKNLREAIETDTVSDKLHSFVPKTGDGIFIQSGTVHTLAGVVVFEVQENSDVTFRLYDWDRIDAKTGKRRDLQVDKAIACIDFAQVNIGPVVPVPDQVNPMQKEQLFNCKHFVLWRIKTSRPFWVGSNNEPRVLVCIAGMGELLFNDKIYLLIKGDVILLPASTGTCNVQPSEFMNLLEIGIPSN